MGFTENRARRLLLSDAIVKVGKAVPEGKMIDVKHLLQCSTTVRHTVYRKYAELRSEFKSSSVQEMLEVGGGVTLDGLKEKIHEINLYNLVVHYFSFSQPHPIRICAVEESHWKGAGHGEGPK